MSNSSEDIELSKLQRAAEFMHGVRLAQAGQSNFFGRNYRSPQQLQQITEAVSNSSLVTAVKHSTQTDLPINHLAERFEEMARRQGVTVDPELRPAVVKLLTTELWVNQTALNVPAKKLVSATLYQGAVAPELLKEFSGLPRYAIWHALRETPASCRMFLKQVEKEVAALAAVPEFQQMVTKRPSALIEAAIYCPSKAGPKLRAMAIEAGYWAKQEAERETRKPSSCDKSN